MFLEGNFLSRLLREFTFEDARQCVAELVPYGLRDKIDERGVAFDFEFGQLCKVMALVSKDGESYRLRMKLIRRGKNGDQE